MTRLDREPDTDPIVRNGRSVDGRGAVFGAVFSRFLGACVDRVSRSAWLVASLALLATAAGGTYAATHLEMQTDTSALLSRDMPYRVLNDAFDAAFPQIDGTLAIVVEGTTADQADDVARRLYRELSARTDRFNYVFYPGAEPFFRKNGLLYLDTAELHSLVTRLAVSQPLIAALAEDMSLRGLFDILGQGLDEVAKGKAKPGPLVRTLTHIADTVAARLDGREARLSWRELMSPKPLGPSDRRRVLLAQPKSDFTSFAPDGLAIAGIRRFAASLDANSAPELHGARVLITGGPAIREDELKSVGDSVGLASIISLVLVSVIVFLGLRSPRLVLAMIVTLFVGLVWTATFAAIAIGHLNLISVAFAVLFIGLAVDFGIQFGLRYRELRDGGGANRNALRGAASSTGVAVGLAALCAMIGFFAFAPTNYVGLAELGIIAGVGMILGVLATFTVLPALLTLLPPSQAAARGRRTGAAALGRFQVRHGRAIGLVALALGLVALLALPRARFDIDPINLKDPTTESVQAFKTLAKNGETSPYSISVVEPTLDAAVALAKRLDKLPLVAKTVTLHSFLPRGQDEKLDAVDQAALFLTPVLELVNAKAPPSAAQRRAALASFRDKLAGLAASPHAGALAAPARRLADLVGRYDGRAAAADPDLTRIETALVANLPGRLADLREAMGATRITLDDLPQDLRRRYLTRDGRARVEVYPAKDLTKAANLRRFVNAVRAVAPHATDMPVMLLESGDAVVRAFEQGGALAFVVIAILLVVVLRSVVDSLFVLLPLSLAGVLTVAVMVVAGRPFNFANVFAMPLLLSLGVAFGIYLVMRFRETGDVVALMRTSTPRAILFSALTTIASFGSLMVSSHRGTASMGMLLAIGLAMALTCTVLVLPALLAWRGARAKDHPTP